MSEKYITAVEKAGKERVETTISFIGGDWDNVVVIPIEKRNNLRKLEEEVPSVLYEIEDIVRRIQYDMRKETDANEILWDLLDTLELKKKKLQL